MRGKSNFDEGCEVLMQHKILIAVMGIVFVVKEGINLLVPMLIKGNMNIVATMIISLLEVPLFFGVIKLSLNACRNEQTSLGQLVEFYKPQLLFKSLLYGAAAMILYVVGLGAIFFIGLALGTAFGSVTLSFLSPLLRA